MRYGKLFLLDRGKIIIVRNAKGEQVSFHSIEEFNKYYPALDLSGKAYINYEPERRPIATYIDDSDPEISAKDIPNAGYEDVIAAASDLKEQKADPYFGMSLAEAKARRIKEIKKETMCSTYLKWPMWKQINCNAGIYAPEMKTEKDSDITGVIAAVDAAELQIGKAETIAAVKKIKAAMPFEVESENPIS